MKEKSELIIRETSYRFLVLSKVYKTPKEGKRRFKRWYTAKADTQIIRITKEKAKQGFLT